MKIHKFEWRSVLRVKLRINKSAGQGPKGDCHTCKGTTTKGGYILVGVKLTSGKWISLVAHKLIYLLVYGEVPKNKELSHLCHRPDCCNLAHLKAESHIKNMNRSRKAKRLAYGVRNGSHTHPEERPIGSRNGGAKLTDNLVIDIIKKYTKLYKKFKSVKYVSPAKIARRVLLKKYNISGAALERILYGKSWKHLKLPPVYVRTGMTK